MKRSHDCAQWKTQTVNKITTPNSFPQPRGGECGYLCAANLQVWKLQIVRGLGYLLPFPLLALFLLLVVPSHGQQVWKRRVCGTYNM
jgi:hypothetical protein